MQPPKNQLQQNEKHHTSYEVQCFFGGEQRDRTADLLHAMQALSRTTLKRTPRKACVNGYDLALIRQIRLKSVFLSNNQHSCMRTIQAQNSFGCILQSDLPAVKMFHIIHAAKVSQYSSISNYIAQFRPPKSKLRFFHSSINFFTGGFLQCLYLIVAFSP